LKNAGATYQRTIQMCFAVQLHRNVEAYVDDVVIKTRNPDGLIADLNVQQPTQVSVEAQPN
jgi:hypothetical protein